MTVQTESFAVHTVRSARDADAATLDRLEQEIVDLDALILATVRRRSDLARSLASTESIGSDTTASHFDDLGPDGPALDRMLARLSAADPQ
ncbi:chorismate mutase [Prescottella agglutinans]|uniref:chorismate mutase n=1 Tax=Prescottella agglutinans TaxID=1644129 RepID=UPI003D999811